ncbi:MAG TPA: ABC transporter permease subunit [Chloroflexi bacterium]|nr:ABC transporter permease subunit [Chloroflexota bacterium]
MIDVNSTFVKFMASLAVVPIGGYLGYIIFKSLTDLGRSFTGGGEASASALLWSVLPVLGFAVLKGSADGGSKLFATLRRVIISAVITVVVVLALAALANVGRGTGTDLKIETGLTGVIGNFILILSDAILLGMPVLGFVIGFFLISSMAGSVTEMVEDRASEGVVRIVAIVLAAIAGMLWFGVITAVLNWLYQFGDLRYVIIAPAVIGAVLLTGIAIASNPHRIIPTGMFIYYIVRTIMNIFRSIEPLVMVVAFAVWVGIGPFAGVMALGLHTIVALGKLYSEQVENIAVGPIEAVTATGANRLQMIIYAVMPQIVPPYIAFTLYRWDINVRMSTIIGFGGGGGIGFLLSQNINLLKYRQASVNMIAIAIVVASLDYLSAKVREKIT